jgi:hypothetical protein
MKKIIFALGIGFAFFANAQNGNDALRYSLLQQGGGTARSMGIGGAVGAFGADFSVMGVNPAGLAAYRTSEFVITPGYYTSEVTSKLKGDGNTAQTELISKFYLNNVGFVSSRLPQYGAWTTRNFAIGINRLASFNSSFYYTGKGDGSIINRFQEKANLNLSEGTALDAFEEGLADETEAIYLKDQAGTYYASDFDGTNGSKITKTQQGTVSGRVNELSLSFAGNYKEKLMIGASFGIPFASFTENKIYEEADPQTLMDKNNGEIPNFKSLRFEENLSQSGVGFNAKLGLIFVPTQNLRIGAAVQTPTAYAMTDNYSTSFDYNFVVYNKTSGKYQLYEKTAKSPDGSIDYNISTPAKITGSMVYLFGKKGFISTDLDYVDYTTMRLGFDVEDSKLENEKNQEIRNGNKSAVNLRVGGEFVADIFRFRAGFATLGFPSTAYNDRGYFDSATKLYTAGLGIRQNKFYADLAYQISQSNTEEKPYLVSQDFIQPIVNRSQNKSQIVMTIGFKF